MRSVLEKALHKIDGLPVKASGEKLDANDGTVGSWQLAKSLKLAVAVVSEAAEFTGDFMSFEALQNRLNAKEVRPIAPLENDPVFDPPQFSYDTPQERLIARRYRFQKAYKKYETALLASRQAAAELEHIRQSFGYGMAAYLKYADAEITKLTPAESAGGRSILAEFLTLPRALPVPEAAVEYGTFIVGNHGSGKSEVIKQRIWHYLNKPTANETIIVIDPHGQMAPEIARMLPNFGNDRLVYLDPTLEAGFAPCPEFLKSDDPNDEDVLYKEAEHYGEAIRMMAGSSEPSATGNMETLCRNCAHAILEHDNYNLRDLLELLNTTLQKPGTASVPYPAVYDHACQSPNPEIAAHFQNSFLHKRNYSAAKDALAIRIERIIASPILQRMLFNPPSFNMGELIEGRKVIVINLPFSKLTKPVTRMMAQLYMAQITIAILKRDEANIDQYPPVHLYIDEAQHVVSHATATAINEFRKYKFNLTLATQYTEQFPGSILEAVKGLGVQIAGFCTGKNLETMNAVFELSHKTKDLDETTLLQNQSVGEFHLRSRGADGAPKIDARQFVTDTNLLVAKTPWKDRNAARYMTDAEWATTKQQQLDRYYRQLGGKPGIAKPPAEPASQQDRTTPGNLPPLATDRGYHD